MRKWHTYVMPQWKYEVTEHPVPSDLEARLNELSGHGWVLHQIVARPESLILIVRRATEHPLDDIRDPMEWLRSFEADDPDRGPAPVVSLAHRRKEP